MKFIAIGIMIGYLIGHLWIQNARIDKLERLELRQAFIPFEQHHHRGRGQ